MTVPTKILLDQITEALQIALDQTDQTARQNDWDKLRAALKAIYTHKLFAHPDAIGVAGGEVTDGFQEWLEHGDGMEGIRNAWDAAIAFKSATPKSGDMAHFNRGIPPLYPQPAIGESVTVSIVPQDSAGDMAQGEQEASGLRMELATAMRYIEERDERIKELKAEIANLRFAIERIQTLSVRAAKLIDPILARAAASTGAVPATDASDEVWAAWDAKHSTGAGQISDTARLDWMQNHLMTAEGKVSPEAEVFSVIGNDTGDWQYADTLRDAIDAAIAAAQPKGDGNV